jgi:hypothetical protein
MTPMRGRVFALAVLLGAFLAHGTAAQGAFAPANDEIISAATGLSVTGVAADAQGNSIVVWSQRPNSESPFEAKALRLDAGGGLGPVVDLVPGQDAYRPAVAMTPSGRAFAAWRTEQEDGDPEGVRGRWIEPSGALGPLRVLVEGSAEMDAGEVHVVIDPSEVASVVWGNQVGNEIALRRVQPGGALGTLVPDISGGGGAINHEVAALPGGETVAVWRGGGIEFNVVSKALIVGTPDNLDEGGLVADPQLAVDSLGNGLAVWRASEGEDDSVRGRRVGSGGALGAELVIDPNHETEVGSQVDVAADTEDDFVVTWTREDAEEDAIVYVRRGNSLGVPAGPAQPISADGTDGQSIRPALDDDGSGAIAWANNLGVGSFTTLGRTVDSLAAPTGGIQELLADGESIEVASAPAIGFAAFLIEYSISGSQRTAFVRRFMPPPTCSDSSATVVQGQPIEAPLDCTGLAIEGAQVIAPPQHGEIGAFSAGGPTLGYTPTPGFEGTDSFVYAATNDGGSSNQASVVISVGKDTVRPRITSLRFVRSVRKPRASASAKRRKAKKPAFKFLLKLSEPASSRVTVERAGPGIRKGKRCSKPRPGARGKRCTRWRRIGSVASNADLTSVTLRVRGKLYKRLLKGGRFRAKGVATDPAGNRSNEKTLGFKLKKKRR